MYQQGFCSSYCYDHAKLCDPRIRYMVEYPSACCSTVPDFNKPRFPKERYDSGQPVLRKKLRKRRRCKSITNTEVSDCMLQMTCAMPEGSCPVQQPCCKSKSNCDERKGGGCERVQETCTEFMEIVQEAVQDTVQQCTKATLEELYEKITCKIDELACQMKEVKEVVSNVGAKNDMRFKCICEFLFAHLKPALDKRASKCETRNESCNEPKQKHKSNVCCCKQCLAKAQDSLGLRNAKSQTSVGTSKSMGSMCPEEKKCFACHLRKMPSSYSLESNDKPYFDEPNCEISFRTPNVNSHTKSTHGAQCQCAICESYRKSKRASKNICSCSKTRAPSPPLRPCRKMGGQNRIGFIERWTARDYKPNPERTQILSEHCSRLDENSDATKVSFPEILIDEPLSPPDGFKDASSDTDCPEKHAHSEKTVCSSSNYCEYNMRPVTPDAGCMRSNL